MRRIGVLTLLAIPVPVFPTLMAVGPAALEPVGLLAVRVDSSAHNVILTAGPFDLPGDGDRDQRGAMNDCTVAAPLMGFSWPVEGWIRGVKVRVVDREGRPLPRTLVRQLLVVNFARRQLLYPQAERLIGWSQETEDIRLPATIGIPVAAAMPMAVFVAWHNGGPRPVTGATVGITIRWTATRVVPRPVSALPVPINVIYPVGRSGDFDLPAGPTQWAAEFTLPFGGRILVAGGHLHDYGTGLRLEEVKAGGSRSIVRLATKRTAEGQLLAVDRILPGAAGDGIKLMGGRTYRLVATYDNPTGTTLVRGAMANLVLLFAPERLEAWPAVSGDDSEYRKDLEYLESLGRSRRGR